MAKVTKDELLVLADLFEERGDDRAETARSITKIKPETLFYLLPLSERLPFLCDTAERMMRKGGAVPKAAWKALELARAGDTPNVLHARRRAWVDIFDINAHTAHWVAIWALAVAYSYRPLDDVDVPLYWEAAHMARLTERFFCEEILKIVWKEFQ